MTTHGFELLREQHIPEYNTQAKLWRHVKTGAELLSLENDDENKVFGVTFRTPPSDSTGVPHILEHAVLAGSRKYQVREPFVELIKGSLNTFLNAFTYPDKTCYPVASLNVQDFYNLIDVYLDAIYYPLLKRHTFEQEGWHYELDTPDAPLAFKGVVFNEMKGAMSSPDRVLVQYAQESVFPDNTYGVLSGGDPKVMPDLTYEQFTAFHHTLYHPSNSRIYFYGDDDPERRLELLDEWLREFEHQDVDSAIPLQERFTEPRHVEHFYAAGEESADGNKSMIALNWLLPEPNDVELSLALGILEEILIGNPASPLRKALIESGLGEDLAGRGLDSDMRQMYFSAGLKGIAAEDAAKVEALILATLQELTGGIDPETVQAALNTVGFQLRENNTGSFPRGLVLMLRALGTWLYDGDPLAPLLFEAPLHNIKERVAAGEPFFEQLISRYFLDNAHRTTVLLQPSEDLGPQEAAAEQARLDAARARMSDADIAKIVEDTRALKLIQETPDAPEELAKIPMLSLADLDKQNKNIPLHEDNLNGAPLLYHDLFTNGIAYLDIGFDLHTLSQDLLPYVPLFGRALLEMGAAGQDFVQLSQRIGRDTGGIHPQVTTLAVRGSKKSAAWFFLRGKAMLDQSDHLLGILRDVLLTPNLDDRERFRQIVLEEKAGEEAGMVGAGHQVINARLRAQFDEAGWAAEEMGGVSYLFFLRRLAEQIESDWPAVLAMLERLRGLLINRNAALLNVTLDAANWAGFRPQLVDFVASLPEAPVSLAEWTRQAGSHAEALVVPSRVNYVGQAANLYDLGYELHGSQAVITKFLGTTWLWERVRVRGGAYGGFGLFDLRSGVWSYLSYRDPNLLATLDVYAGTGQFLKELELDEQALTSAIIGAIGQVDAYQLPDAKGWTSLQRYLADDSDEDRQRRREQILATTEADFHTFGAALARIGADAPVAVLGGQSAIEAANMERPGFFEIKQVM